MLNYLAKMSNTFKMLSVLVKTRLDSGKRVLDVVLQLTRKSELYTLISETSYLCL